MKIFSALKKNRAPCLEPSTFEGLKEGDEAIIECAAFNGVKTQRLVTFSHYLSKMSVRMDYQNGKVGLIDCVVECDGRPVLCDSNSFRKH